MGRARYEPIAIGAIRYPKVRCGSTAAVAINSRTIAGPLVAHQRRFRCRCGKQFNERSAGVLNKAQYPSDIIALVVLWRLRLAEMFLTRGFIFTYEAVREWRRS